MNFLFWCWIDTRFVGLCFLRLSCMVRFVCHPRLIMIWFKGRWVIWIITCILYGDRIWGGTTIFFFDFLAFFFLFCLLFEVVLLASFSFFAAMMGSALACNLAKALRVGFGLGFSLIMFNGVITGASGGLCGHCGIKWVMPQSLHAALGRCGLATGVALVLGLYGQSATLWGSPEWKHYRGFLSGHSLYLWGPPQP